MLIVLLPLNLFSQNIRKFEFEIGSGINFGHQNVKSDYRDSKANFLIEGRYNHSKKIDFGIQFLFAPYDNKEAIEKQEIKHYMVQPVADFYFRAEKIINPFVGLGIGINHVKLDFKNGPKRTDNSIVFTPRLGFEFFKHLRTTLDYRIISSNPNFFNLTIGVVIGGGVKNT